MEETHFQVTHYPVFHKEIIDFYKMNLDPHEIYRFLDGTGGEGGHVELVLEAFPNSEIIFLDRDPIMLTRAMKRLNSNPKAIPKELNFSEVNPSHLEEWGWEEGIDGILLDLGISTYHLTDSRRGFSFRGEENLDMRLSQNDGENSLTAEEIVNRYSGKELERIFYDYGEERWTKKIVERILERRKIHHIQTNMELAKIVESAIPRKFWPPKSHPSVRIFQALRIEVNQEMFHLEKSIRILPPLLRQGGIIQIISFHSLEDRLVKHGFRDWKQKGGYSIETKKPILPSEQEVRENLPSRSAKLRVLKKIQTSDGSKER